MARRTRLCPYCGERLPACRPFGLPSYVPWVCWLSSIVLVALSFPSGVEPWSRLPAVASALCGSPSAVLLLSLAGLSLFLPPVPQGPGVPSLPWRRRVVREVLWRIVYLLASALSVGLVAVSLRSGAWRALPPSVVSIAVVVCSTPFYALPAWTYPVCPLLLAAALCIA